MNMNNLKISQSSEAINMKKYLSVTLMALSISILTFQQAADLCKRIMHVGIDLPQVVSRMVVLGV